MIGRVLQSTESLSPPLPLRLPVRWPLLRRIPARVIGIGFRPEQVNLPAAVYAGQGLLLNFPNE